VDHIIEEPLGGAHRDHHQTASRVKQYLLRSLRELLNQPRETRPQTRYEKFRRMGMFLEDAAAMANGRAGEGNNGDGRS